VKLNIKLTVGAVALLCVVILSCVPASKVVPATESGPATPSVSSIPPYQFELANLSILPKEAEAGTSVQATVSVKNVGSAPNAYVATLYVDGQEYTTRDLTLKPGESGNLTYMVSNLGAGDHRLSVGNLADSVRIYTTDKYTVANNQIYMPHYTPLQYTPAPSLPYISSDPFSAPVTPFYITRINFRYPYPQSFRILDASNKQLYSADIEYNESAYVPGVQVNGDFTIQMQTGQPAVDIKSQFFGFSTWELVIAYFWPEVSTVEGFQKRFVP
jgi:hypothetical protein